MTIHVTIPGVLEVIGGAVAAGVVAAVLYGAFVLWRWGK